MKPKVQNWINQLQSGIIKSKTTRILHSIHSHTISKGYTSVYELRNELKLPHQTLTAILSSVQDEGMIDMFGEIVIDDTIYQKIRYAHPNERIALINSREREKFKQWCNRGINDFAKFIPDDYLKSFKEWIDLA